MERSAYRASASCVGWVVSPQRVRAALIATIDVYGHLWPDSDDSTRAAVDKVLAARAGSPAD
jgi:hypothetical protein